MWNIKLKINNEWYWVSQCLSTNELIENEKVFDVVISIYENESLFFNNEVLLNKILEKLKKYDEISEILMIEIENSNDLIFADDYRFFDFEANKIKNKLYDDLEKTFETELDLNKLNQVENNNDSSSEINDIDTILKQKITHLISDEIVTSKSNFDLQDNQHHKETHNEKKVRKFVPFDNTNFFYSEMFERKNESTKNISNLSNTNNEKDESEFKDKKSNHSTTKQMDNKFEKNNSDHGALLFLNVLKNKNNLKSTPIKEKNNDYQIDEISELESKAKLKLTLEQKDQFINDLRKYKDRTSIFSKFDLKDIQSSSVPFEIENSFLREDNDEKNNVNLVAENSGFYKNDLFILKTGKNNEQN